MRGKRTGKWTAASSWRDALHLEDSDHIALMGAGGKTTTMWSIGRELSRDAPTVVTSTTKAGSIPDRIPVVAWAGELPGHGLQEAVSTALQLSHLIALTNGERDQRLEGVSPIVVDEVFLRCDARYLINEADGARMKAFKAPAEHEPVIPSTTSLAAVMLGLEALGAPINEEHLHRPEQIVALSGASLGAPLSASHIATIVAEYLGRLDFLQSVRPAIIINKVDQGPDDAKVAELVAAFAGLDVAAIVAASQKTGTGLWRLT